MLRLTKLFNFFRSLLFVLWFLFKNFFYFCFSLLVFFFRLFKCIIEQYGWRKRWNKLFCWFLEATSILDVWKANLTESYHFDAYVRSYHSNMLYYARVKRCFTLIMFAFQFCLSFLMLLIRYFILSRFANVCWYVFFFSKFTLFILFDFLITIKSVIEGKVTKSIYISLITIRNFFFMLWNTDHLFRAYGFIDRNYAYEERGYIVNPLPNPLLKLIWFFFPSKTKVEDFFSVEKLKKSISIIEYFFFFIIKIILIIFTILIWPLKKLGSIFVPFFLRVYLNFLLWWFIFLKKMLNFTAFFDIFSFFLYFIYMFPFVYKVCNFIHLSFIRFQHWYCLKLGIQIYSVETFIFSLILNVMWFLRKIMLFFFNTFKKHKFLIFIIFIFTHFGFNTVLYIFYLLSVKITLIFFTDYYIEGLYMFSQKHSTIPLNLYASWVDDSNFYWYMSRTVVSDRLQRWKEASWRTWMWKPGRIFKLPRFISKADYIIDHWCDEYYLIIAHLPVTKKFVLYFLFDYLIMCWFRWVCFVISYWPYFIRKGLLRCCQLFLIISSYLWKLLVFFFFFVKKYFVLFYYSLIDKFHNIKFNFKIEIENVYLQILLVYLKGLFFYNLHFYFFFKLCYLNFSNFYDILNFFILIKEYIINTCSSFENLNEFWKFIYKLLQSFDKYYLYQSLNTTILKNIYFCWLNFENFLDNFFYRLIGIRKDRMRKVNVIPRLYEADGDLYRVFLRKSIDEVLGHFNRFWLYSKLFLYFKKDTMNFKLFFLNVYWYSHYLNCVKFYGVCTLALVCFCLVFLSGFRALLFPNINIYMNNEYLWYFFRNQNIEDMLWLADDISKIIKKEKVTEEYDEASMPGSVGMEKSKFKKMTTDLRLKHRLIKSFMKHTLEEMYNRNVADFMKVYGTAYNSYKQIHRENVEENMIQSGKKGKKSFYAFFNNPDFDSFFKLQILYPVILNLFLIHGITRDKYLKYLNLNFRLNNIDETQYKENLRKKEVYDSLVSFFFWLDKIFNFKLPYWVFHKSRFTGKFLTLVNYMDLAQNKVIPSYIYKTEFYKYKSKTDIDVFYRFYFVEEIPELAEISLFIFLACPAFMIHYLTSYLGWVTTVGWKYYVYIKEHRYMFKNLLLQFDFLNSIIVFFNRNYFFDRPLFPLGGRYKRYYSHTVGANEFMAKHIYRRIRWIGDVKLLWYRFNLGDYFWWHVHIKHWWDLIEPAFLKSRLWFATFSNSLYFKYLCLLYFICIFLVYLILRKTKLTIQSLRLRIFDSNIVEHLHAIDYHLKIKAKFKEQYGR